MQVPQSVSAKLKLDRCGTDRSYADDVRKEMTRPSTVPSTVRIALETDSLWGVISDTSVTTVHPRVSMWGYYGSRRDDRSRLVLTCRNPGEEEHFRPYVVNDCRLELLQAPACEEGILRDHLYGQSTADG